MDAAGPVLLLFCVIFGLAIGSFLNVVIYRVPLKLSLSKPGSRCPSCEHPIRARHNVPVLGWLMLRGRCADCAAPISVRYPLVELGTGIGFGLLAWRLDSIDRLTALPGFWYFLALGIALSLIDLDLRRLPTTMILPSYPVLLVLLVAAALVSGHPWSIVRALIGAAIVFAFFMTIRLISPAGMGMGDVRLSGLLGLVLGYLSWWSIALGTFAGFLLGSLVGVVVMIIGRGGRKTALPFGPFMIAGTLVAIFLPIGFGSSLYS